MGRFINADSYASTGQGIIGCNMFAYCLNNPVIFADFTGSLGELVIFPLLAALTPIVYTAAVTITAVAAVVAVAYLVYTAADYVNDVVNQAKKNKASSTEQKARSTLDFASTTAPPPPPGNNGRGTQTTSKTLYNKNGVRVDVENPGNRPGQIHVQIKGDSTHYYYNVEQQTFRVNSSNGAIAPKSIQQLLENGEIIRAIAKGLGYLGY